MDVDGEDGVTPGAVLVHVVSPDGSVLQTLLQDSHEIIQLPALDTEQIVHHKGPGPLVPSDREVGPLGPRIEEVNHLHNVIYKKVLHNEAIKYKIMLKDWLKIYKADSDMQLSDYNYLESVLITI